MIEIEDNLECPICLEEIDLESGDFIELECCKNKGHIKCLEKWIKVNKSDGKCYYCRQNNNYFKLVKTSTRENNQNNRNNQNIILNGLDSENRNCIIICLINSYFIILTISLILIFLII